MPLHVAVPRDVPGNGVRPGYVSLPEQSGLDGQRMQPRMPRRIHQQRQDRTLPHRLSSQ